MGVRKKPLEYKTCECGCGQTIPRWDTHRTWVERRFVAHHSFKGLWWHDGKPHTTLGKCRPDARERMLRNNPNKKHGLINRQISIRGWREYTKWKSDILSRDGNQCVGCGSNKNIEIHHIISVKNIIKKFGIKSVNDAINCNLLWNINNGLTLCRRCHMLSDGRMEHLIKISRMR